MTYGACLACARAACGFRHDVENGKCTCGRYPARGAATDSGADFAPDSASGLATNRDSTKVNPGQEGTQKEGAVNKK